MKIDNIRIDGGTQPRSRIDETLVDEYALAMKDGDKFPPLVVFFDGVDNWLADGFHRFHAARKILIKDIEADINQGTKRDAILYSVSANATHGQRRTNADKQKAVMTLLKDEEWAAWSDREIARRCAVGHQMVGHLRSSLDDSSSEKTARTYTTKHGTTSTMNTEKIGRVEPVETERPTSKGKGIRYAHEAINALKKIPKNDGLRTEAFKMVADWIKQNR